MSKRETIKNMKEDESTDFGSESGDESNDIQEYKSTKKQSKKLIKRVKFLPSEDKTISDLVSIYGTDWKLISQSFGPTRTKRQLRERWQNYLNPDCNPTYTEEEDTMLMDLVTEIGTKWAKIAEIIGKKSAISCRNRHRILIKEKNKKSGSKSSKNSNHKNSEVVNNLNEKNQTNEKLENSQNDSPKLDSNSIDNMFDNFEFDDDIGSSFFYSSPLANNVTNNCFDYDESLFELDLYYNY